MKIPEDQEEEQFEGGESEDEEEAQEKKSQSPLEPELPESQSQDNESRGPFTSSMNNSERFEKAIQMGLFDQKESEGEKRGEKRTSLDPDTPDQELGGGESDDEEEHEDSM